MQSLKTKSLSWYHFEKATPAELEWLWKTFHFHPLVMDELTRPTVRPKVDFYDEYLYLVLHFPILSSGLPEPKIIEVDCILTKRELVTFTHEPAVQISDFFKKCSLEASCADLYASRTPAHLLFFVIKEFYQSAIRDLDHVDEMITAIENKVFSASDREIISELSIVRRQVIDFRRVLKPHQETLESLALQGHELYGNGLKHFWDSLKGEYLKAWNFLENNKEAVDALYDNNVTFLNIKQNEAMRIVAIMAFITFPLMLFTALFSMNTVATPILGNRYDFWIIVGIMFAATFSMFLIFKRKKWL